jgi:cytochrome bd-type quinol oxidase subunit 1
MKKPWADLSVKERKAYYAARAKIWRKALAALYAAAVTTGVADDDSGSE